jgi:NADH-quinone oxidoreductase subunit H
MRFCVVFFFAIACWIASGCGADAPASLIQVTDFAPREAEVGDRLEITGVGFPQGRTARVVLRGALHRPGASPERVDLPVDGTVVSARQIEILYGEGLEAQLCTRGLRRAHTTFAGDVEVSFSAVAVGAPPVSALLRGVVLDLRPPVTPDELKAASAEGERTLAFLGLTVSDGGEGGGLLIEAVAPGSRAERAGVGVGDRLVAFDTLRVGSRADLVPRPGRVASLGLRRADESAEVVREVPVDGLSPGPSDEVLAALALALTAIALLLAFFAPAEGPLTHLERRAAHRLRSAAWLRRPPAAALVAGAICAITLLVLPSARFLVSADLDVAVLFVCAVAATVIASAGRGGFGLRRAATLLSYEVLAAVGFASVMVATGSLRLHDVVRAQGALPWEWAAFRSPASLVLFLLFGTGALVGEADAPARPRAWLAAAETTSAFVRAGLAAAVFLGGWQLPAGWREGFVGVCASGGLFFAKACALVAVGALARASLAGAAPLRRPGFGWKWLLPASLVSLAVCVAWTAWAPAEHVQTAVGGTLFALSVIVLVRGAYRVRFFWAEPSSDGALDMYA